MCESTFPCPLCLDDHPLSDKFIISSCGHSCCRACASKHISVQIESAKFPISCWEKPSCNSEISYLDCELVLSDEMLSRLNIISLSKIHSNSNIKTIRCISKTCGFFYILDENDLIPDQVTCAKCKTCFCPKCEVSYHSNQTCDEYKRSRVHLCPRQNCKGFVSGPDLRCVCPTCQITWCWECSISPYHDGKTCRDILRQICKNCPGCGVASEKTKDCNHLKCPRCKTDWCYLCESKLCSKNPNQHYGVQGTPCYGKCFAEKDIRY